MAEMQSLLREVEALDRDLNVLLGSGHSPTSHHNNIIDSMGTSATSTPFTSHLIVPTAEEIMPLLANPNTNNAPDRSLSYKRNYVNDVHEQSMDCVEAVDVAMRLMDSRYGTAFYPWIRDETNVDTISQHFRRFIYEMPTGTVALSLRWLFERWSVNGITTLLIKLYYERGLTASPFPELVSQLCVGRTWQKTVDLIGTLLIGEEAPSTALFLAKVTQDWEVSVTVELVHEIAETSKWTSTFHEEVLLHFSIVPSSETEDPLPYADRITRMQEVKKMFADRASAMQYMPTDKSSLYFGHTHRKFAQKVLTQLLQEQQQQRRLLQSRAAIKQRQTAPSTSLITSTNATDDLTIRTADLVLNSANNSTKTSPIQSHPLSPVE
jgi:hypothetical protein